MESPLTWTEWCHPHLCSTPCLNSFFVLVKVPFFSTLLTTAFRERREGKAREKGDGKRGVTLIPPATPQATFFVVVVLPMLFNSHPTKEMKALLYK